MNHREPTHLPAGVRRALHCLSLLLVPAMAPERVHAMPRSRPLGSGPNLRNAGSTPYLPPFGSPALRFQEAPPRPNLASVPPPGAVTPPSLPPAEASVALANAAAAQSAASEPAEASSSTNKPSDQNVSTPNVPAKSPPAILPDAARPSVRPEDFLPYFQIPGSARQPSDVTLLVPAAPSAPTPNAIPPSSATYTQTPK